MAPAGGYACSLGRCVKWFHNRRTTRRYKSERTSSRSGFVLGPVSYRVLDFVHRIFDRLLDLAGSLIDLSGMFQILVAG